MAILVFAKDQRQYNDYIRAQHLTRSDAIYASCVNKLRGLFPKPTEMHLLPNWDHSGPSQMAMEKAKTLFPQAVEKSIEQW